MRGQRLTQEQAQVLKTLAAGSFVAYYTFCLISAAFLYNYCTTFTRGRLHQAPEGTTTSHSNVPWTARW